MPWRRKEMATHPSILAWKTPWTEEPGGLQSMWLQRVRYDWWLSMHVPRQGPRASGSVQAVTKESWEHFLCSPDKHVMAKRSLPDHRVSNSREEDAETAKQHCPLRCLLLWTLPSFLTGMHRVLQWKECLNHILEGRVRDSWAERQTTCVSDKVYQDEIDNGAFRKELVLWCGWGGELPAGRWQETRLERQPEPGERVSFVF